MSGGGAGSLTMAQAFALMLIADSSGRPIRIAPVVWGEIERRGWARMKRAVTLNPRRKTARVGEYELTPEGVDRLLRYRDKSAAHEEPVYVEIDGVKYDMRTPCVACGKAIGDHRNKPPRENPERGCKGFRTTSSRAVA